MWPTRIAAMAALLFLRLFILLRAAAQACVGAACDWYVPASVLVPLLIVVSETTVGLLVTSDARQSATAWLPTLLLLAVLGVVGPFVSLAVFQGRPDQFVGALILLEVPLPTVTLVYTGIRAAASPP